MSNIDRNIKELLDWYIEKQDPVPLQLHTSRVFASDGRPDWTPAFKEYLFWRPDSIEYRQDKVICTHDNQKDPNKCDVCGIRNDAGEILASSGSYRRASVRYKHPMRRALVKLAGSERGVLFAGVLMLCSRDGASLGIRRMQEELVLSEEKAKQLLLMALVRVARYYRNEPQYGALALAQTREMRHNYRRPSRLATPDRS